MVRAFRTDPVPPEILDRVLDAARRGPSAGFVQATELVVLEGPEQTERYWSCTLTPDRRRAFPWPGLLHAPVLVLLVVSPPAYTRRYREPDKAASGLGRAPEVWPVPYWYVDAGAALMLLLLAAADEDLGAGFFGLFEHEAAAAEAFGVPGDHRIVGTVALGYPAPDRPSRSLRRGRRALDDIVHRGGW